MRFAPFILLTEIAVRSFCKMRKRRQNFQVRAPFAATPDLPALATTARAQGDWTGGTAFPHHQARSRYPLFFVSVGASDLVVFLAITKAVRIRIVDCQSWLMVMREANSYRHFIREEYASRVEQSGLSMHTATTENFASCEPMKS